MDNDSMNCIDCLVIIVLCDELLFINTSYSRLHARKIDNLYV